MNTQFALLAQYGTPVIQLKDVCEEYFGLKIKTAETKAKTNELPIPAFKLRDSERAPTMVNLTDLANYIDSQLQQARENWNLSNAIN